MIPIWCNTPYAITTRKPVTCRCQHLNGGIRGSNGYTCTDGKRGHCASSQECYARGAFKKGKWSHGCRRPTPSPTERTPAPTVAMGHGSIGISVAITNMP